MVEICWQTYRRALAVCLTYGLAFAASVGAGWVLAQADPVSPVISAKSAPSGTSPSP